MTGSPEKQSRLGPAALPLLLAGFVLGTAAAPAPSSPEAQAEAGLESEWEVLDERPGAGEQCLVCGQPIVGKGIVELRHQGRRFHVSADMLDDFEGDPAAYFSKLQARSALFDERSVVREPMATGWLSFGLYVLLGLVSAAACGYLAVAKALPAGRWFLGGLFFNVLAFAALLAAARGDTSRLPAGIPAGLAKVPRTSTPRACPACGTLNHPTARRCACGAELAPAGEPETSRV